MSAPPLDPVVSPARAFGRRRRGRRARGELSDRAMVLLAVGVALGAWVARPLPVWPLALAATAALALRRPVLLGVVAALLASGLAAQAWAGARPVGSGPWSGRATLVTDAERLVGAVHAEVRADGHHFDLWAHGRAGSVLSQRAAGQLVEVRGRTSPRPADDDRSARRHIVGRIEAEQIVAAGDGNPVMRLANAIRATLQRGASVMPTDQRALFAGFVLGDEREQSIAVADDFRGAGLTHLLVVSGENVAFVLVVAMPVVRCLGRHGRWLATLGLIGLFGVITRFEPSVLRASAMAAIAVSAWMLGRPVTGLRALALAVAALLLVDPLLVGVLGFQLSVAASAGILLLARPLADHLPVPRRLAPALSVTLAAQVAVAPLLVGPAGGLPVASVPANLLAEPAAALIMGWGLTAGLLAGMVGPSLAGLLHRPTSALLWWVGWVAHQGADLPLGRLGLTSVAVAAGAGVAAVAASRRGRRRLALVGWAGVAAVLALPSLAAMAPPAPRVELDGVGTLWRAPPGGHGSVLVLAVGARPADVLGELRRVGVDHLDLVVAGTGGSSVESLVTVLRQRIAVDRLWTPPPARRVSAANGPSVPIVGERHPEPGERFDLSGIAVVVTVSRPTLEVSVAVGPVDPPPRPSP